MKTVKPGQHRAYFNKLHSSATRIVEETAAYENAGMIKERVACDAFFAKMIEDAESMELKTLLNSIRQALASGIHHRMN